MTPVDYDLLVIGGGMVGASLAAALSGSGLRIALIEAVSPGGKQQPSYDDRGIALAYGSRLIFEGMGVWPHLALLAEPIQRIHVSDQGRFGSLRMDGRSMGYDALGYVVLARDLGQALMKQLSSCAMVEYISPARLLEFTPFSGGVRARVQTDVGVREMSCRLLVGADGARSRVRERAGIDVDRHDYGQTAIIANITAERRHKGMAFERFTPGGPLAMLPLGPESCSLVWTHPSEVVDHIMALDDAAFLHQLQRAFGYRLGRLKKVGARQAYPLALIRARRYTGDRIALVGNAAHTLHPVAGQGFNLGLRDVAVLAETLVCYRGQAKDPGDPAILQAYARQRRADLNRMSTLTDGLVRLFSNDILPLAIMRDMGLLGLGLAPGMKQRFMRQAMGLGGRLPRLIRGQALIASGIDSPGAGS